MENVPLNEFGRTVPSAEKYSSRKIGNAVISFL